LPEKNLIELMHRYCVTVDTGKVIEGSRNLVEVWLLLETHFNRQTILMDGLLSQLLKTDSVVNDLLALSYYDRVLQPIQKAKELGRMQDLLTPNQVEILLTVLPRKEGNYWRMDQLNIVMEELPLALYNFTRRLLELRLNTSPALALSTTPLSGPAAATDRTWSGPCVIGSIYGKSHKPESNNLFDELSPKGSNNTKKAVMSTDEI
jgi:hypothetical protein